MSGAAAIVSAGSAAVAVLPPQVDLAAAVVPLVDSAVVVALPPQVDLVVVVAHPVDSAAVVPQVAVVAILPRPGVVTVAAVAETTGTSRQICATVPESGSCLRNRRPFGRRFLGLERSKGHAKVPLKP
jgi:hypothetical protein